MKRSLSAVLVITMLMTLLSGITIVSASETASTLKEIIHYDFNDESGYDDYLEYCQNGYSANNNASKYGRNEDKTGTYGIGYFEKRNHAMYIPLSAETESLTSAVKQNGVYEATTVTAPKGVEITGNNLYLEAEFDYQIVKTEKDSVDVTTGGIILDTFKSARDSNGALQLIGAQKAYGALYHQYDETTGKANYTQYSSTTMDKAVMTGFTPTAQKWHRVKIVTQLTDSNGSLSTNNKINIYVDGNPNPIYTQSLHSEAVNKGDGKVRFVRFHQSYGTSAIDNLTVRTYNNIADAPVDKGALVAAIRNFEEKYTTYKDYAEAVTLINSAKAVYENASATQDNVTAALASIEAAEDVVNPKPKTYFSYDFETTENVDAFKAAATEATGKAPSGKTYTDESYGISTYMRITGNSPYLPISPAISRSASENMYIEAEFDMLPVEPTESQIDDGTRDNRAEVYFSSSEKDKAQRMAGICANYDDSNDLNEQCLTVADGKSKKLKSFKYGQWYRGKIVCELGENKTAVRFYIDGNLAGTDTYKKTYDTIDYLRIYVNWSYVGIDNLSVRTYTAENPAPEKDKLVSKIRELIKSYPEYTENAEALALFNQAEAVYKNADATPADVTAALGYLTKAERKLFNAEPLVKENFDGEPDSFFDSGVEGAAYVNDDTYLVTTALRLPASTAVKSFTSVALGETAATKYITAECDVNSASSVTVSLSDSVKYTVGSGSDWTRVRFDIDTVKKTYDVYVNGEKKKAAQAISESALSALTVTGAAEFTIDNATVYGFENTADVVSDKGALVTALRKSKALLDAGTMTADETALMTTIFDKYAAVNERPASKADIENAAKWTAFYNDNLSAQMADAISVVIPGVGKALTDTIVNINLHHKNQSGNEAWNEVFFGGKGSTDFSDVRYYSTEGLSLPSHIESTGNYDFIKESNLIAGSAMYALSDGRLVGKNGGNVRESKDGGKTWENIGGNAHKTANIVFVDRDDNIYHFRENDPDYGPCPLFKLYASDNYNTEKLMIDTSDLYGLYNNYDKNNVVEDYDVTSAHYHTGFDMQDDDGHIYIGRYQTEWTGAALFVSDENGENFRIADFRTDKQHVHSISINHNVYPNEVYVCYDDSYNQPLCYVSTDHFGYAGLKDSAIHQLPTVACSTGGREKFKSIQSGDLYESILMPKNQATDDIMAYAKKHATQVPIPFGNGDYLRHFGLIEDRESAPEKFEYNEEMGKWYTKKNKEYYNENSGFTHYYSDNIYALGCGEANILGGPGAYKTTDIMNPLKYYPVIKTTEGARRIMSPAEGVIIYSALTGGYAQQAQSYISYDDGETWDIAYTTGYQYGDGAGDGHGRYITGPVSKADGTTEIFLNGFGVDVAIRGLFGGDNYFALSSVKLPTLPEDGIKIFVKQDGETKKAVTTYYYGTINGNTPAIRSSKTAEGKGDALTFPLVGTGKDMIYTFDVDTEADTIVEAALTASTNHGNEDVAMAVFNTVDGTIALNGVKATASEVVKGGSFTAKIVTSADGKAKLYVDDTFTCEAKLSYEYLSLAQLSFTTKDAEGSAPTLASPVEVYYSNVAYGEYDISVGQYLLENVTLANSDGSTANALADGVTIKTATISKVDMDIDAGTLFACIYDTDTGHMINCAMVDVKGSGTYDINLTSDRDDAVMKFFLVKDLKTLVPVTLTNLIEEAVK